MIIVKLMGGLGNQMFQYAAGRALSQKHHVPLKLDLSYLKREWLERLKGNVVRKYALGIFDIKEEFATTFDWFSETRFTTIVNRFNGILKSRAPYILKEIPFDLKDNLDSFAKTPPNTFLDGFWQSEGYFKEAKDLIIKDLRFKTLPLGLNLQFAKQIAANNAVSLHIRHDDYLANQRTHNFHGVCPLEYYLTCINKIKDQVKNPLFFVFGDDLEWAKKNLPRSETLIFVEHNVGTESYFEDLRLMSLCKHNIIANSSFSWWGAYLNQNLNKIVLAPKPWIKAKINAPSIIPANWVEIETQLM